MGGWAGVIKNAFSFLHRSNNPHHAGAELGEAADRVELEIFAVVNSAGAELDDAFAAFTEL